MSDYVYGHVRNWEADKFEKYSMDERQIQYIKKVILNKPKCGIKKLKSILDWKFGKCILKETLIKELRKTNNEC